LTTAYAKRGSLREAFNVVGDDDSTTDRGT